MAEYGEAVRDIDDERREFLESRQSGIFATDTPKILGFSRWGTPLTVYRDKVNAVDQKPMSLPAWLGLKLESTVAELYTTATGIRVRAAHRTVRHPQYHWLGTHLDYRAWGKPELLVECKTRAYMGGWGADGSANIPADIWTQVQHEMLVTGAKECHIAVLFGHHTYRTYVIKRDEQFLDKLVPRLDKFWHLNVVAGVPPLPTGHDMDSDVVKDENRDHGPQMRSATPEQETIVRQLLLARTNVAQATFNQNELENRIKQIIGDDAGLMGSFGQITWKKSRDGTSVDWEAVAATYVNVVTDLLQIVNPGDDDVIVSRLARAQAVFENAESLFTAVKPGSRRFLVTPKEEV